MQDWLISQIRETISTKFQNACNRRAEQMSVQINMVPHNIAMSMFGVYHNQRRRGLKYIMEFANNQRDFDTRPKD